MTSAPTPEDLASARAAAALLPARMAAVAALGRAPGTTSALPFAVPVPLTEVVTAGAGEATGWREGTAVQSVPELLNRTYGPDSWTGAGAASAERWANTVATLTDTATRWTEHPVVPPSSWCTGTWPPCGTRR